METPTVVEEAEVTNICHVKLCRGHIFVGLQTHNFAVRAFAVSVFIQQQPI